MTEIIKAKDDAALLALIPQLTGYTASESLICVFFSGKRTQGALRVDLPRRRRLADYKTITSNIAASLNRLPHVDGVAIAIYTNASFEAEKGIPFFDFHRHVTSKLADAGFAIKASLCVAADGWGSYFDRDCPQTGRPLAEVTPSVEVEHIDRWNTLPDCAAEDQRTFELELREFGESNRASRSNRELDDVELIELIASRQGDLPRELDIELIWMTQLPSLRDLISLQTAFGKIVGEAVWEQNEEYLQIQQSTGLTMDEVVRRELSAGRVDLDDEFTSLLMGKGRIRPDVQRTELMIARLQRLIALSPQAFRPGPLCVLAYLLWALGLSKAAQIYVMMALEIDPNYGMAHIQFAILDHGMLPEWAYG